MNQEQFIWWLKGYLEGDTTALNIKEVSTIKEKLEKVNGFTTITYSPYLSTTPILRGNDVTCTTTNNYGTK